MSYYRCFCIWPRAVQTHICLCPCGFSHIEPLCIHTYAHKYTYIRSQMHFYILLALAGCALSHLFVPLRVLTLRASSYTCIHSQVYIFHITDAFVYDPVYMHMQLIFEISIFFSQRRYFCIWTHAVWHHICLCLCECSHSEPFSIHRYILTSIHVSYHRYVCIWTKSSHIFVPLLVLTLRNSLFTCICLQVCIVCMYQKSYHRYVCISSRAVHSHNCLCRCKFSHLEPLCIHTYIQKY